MSCAMYQVSKYLHVSTSTSISMFTLPPLSTHSINNASGCQPPQAVYDEALDILTCTAWDGDLQDAKTARSTLAKLVKVDVPSAKKVVEVEVNTTHGREKPRKVDEMESYESLVRTVGY